MKRFSDELVEDREFELGGELFKWRYPHWEVGAELFDEQLKPAENGDGGDFSWKGDTELAIARIPMFLDPANDALNRFAALVERTEDPVPRHLLVKAYRWLFQVTGGLPTEPPSDSASGGGSNDTSSEGESS